MLWMLMQASANASQAVQAVMPAVQHAAASSGGWEQITLGNVVGALTLLFAGCGAFVALDKRNRDRAKDARDDTDRIMAELGKVNTGLANRVERIEDKTQSFMPRGEIIAAVEHEKTNRTQADYVLQTWLDKLDKEARDSDRRLATLEEKSRGFDSDIQELKSLIKTSMEETKTLFKEKMQDLKDVMREQGDATNKRIDDLAHTEADHFEQVCTSLRETTRRESKG